MRVYLNKHNALLLKILEPESKDEEVQFLNGEDFQTRLAGEIVPIERKIEIVQELRDACEVFLEEISQEVMKGGFQNGEN